MNKFTSKFFVGFFSVLFGVAAINVLVDPYVIMPVSLISRMYKNDTCAHMRLIKAIDIIRKKPRAILLGSSRVLLGMSSKDFEELVGMTSYNLALSGASFEEIFAYFQHALHHQKDLKIVVLGLDLFAFNGNRRPSADFNAELLANDRFHGRDYWKALGTIQGIRASIRTLHSLFAYTPHPYVDENGNLPITLLKKRLTPEEPFEEIEKRALKNNFLQPDTYGDFCLSHKSIDLFHRMALICKQRDIELKVFFSPCRAIYWHGIYLKGLWSDLEDLKRELVKSIEIWDFSGCHALSLESFNESLTSSFWDQSHFFPIIGKEILETLLQNQKMRFGRFLNNDNCEEILNLLRKAQEKWPRQHVDEIAFLNQILLGAH